ncbi:MAG TPA: MFS transporter [Lacunisphaera sp.]|jgi:DHA2 family multidrug resistance protein
MSPSQPSLRPYLPLVIALALATGGEVFTSSAVGLALPKMAAQFSASPDEISWAVTFYFVGYLICLPLTAWLSDLLGQKRYVGFSIAIYIAASLGCMASPSLAIFLVMRTIQGAAGACFVARAIFTFTKELRPPVLFRALYIFIGAFSLRAFGLPFGGYLVENLSWRWLFAVPVAVMGFGALPALFLSTEIWPRRTQPKTDFSGLIALAAGFGAFLILLYRGQRSDWFASPAMVVLLATAVVALPVFFWQQNRPTNRRSLITIDSLRYRGMGVGVTLSFLAGVMMVGGIYVLPQFLLRVVGCNAQLTGWLASIDAFGTMAGLALAAWTLGRWPTRLLLTASGIVFTSSLLLFAFRITSATPVNSLYLPLALHGFGVGLALPPIGIFSFRAMGTNFQHSSEGRAWHYTARQLGGAVALAFTVLILDVRTTVHSSWLDEALTNVNQPLAQTVSAIGRGLSSHGLTPALAEPAAKVVVSRIVAREATVLAFQDIFLFTTIFGVAVSVLSFGLPKARETAPAKPIPAAPAIFTPVAAGIYPKL